MAERPVSASISLAVDTQLSMLRLAITTSAPQRATANAISRPRPRLPPVISIDSVGEIEKLVGVTHFSASRLLAGKVRRVRPPWR